MKNITAASVAVLALANSSILHAQTSDSCLSINQAEALVTYVLPKAVEASRSQCGSTLSATAPLMMENSEQLAKYRAASEAAWPEAKEAVNVIANNKMPAGLDDAFLKPVADALFTQLISEEIKPKDCALIDKLYTDLEPMPSANLASLAVTILQEATKDDGKQDIPIWQS